MVDFTNVQLFKIAPEISALQASNLSLKKSNKFLWCAIITITIGSFSVWSFNHYKNKEKYVQK